MNSHYNQNYTKVQIEIILKTIQDCVKSNNYSISINNNRNENREFKNEYNLTNERQKDILLKIKTDDFCHSLKNTNVGFEHEILYVFCPQMILLNSEAIEEMVDIYIKFNIINYQDGKQVVVISFHKRNKPIRYLFR